MKNNLTIKNNTFLREADACETNASDCLSIQFLIVIFITHG